MLNTGSLVSILNGLHLDNRVVCLHSSVRSFGPLENGVATILDAFTEIGSTLIVPAFFYHSITEPGLKSYPQNGVLDKKHFEGQVTDYYDGPDQIDSSMGALPKVLLSRQGTFRSKHPICSFAASGPLAETLMALPKPLDVYGHYEALYQSKETSFIVLAGTDLTRCTPVHFAEQKAGRKLFRRWTMYHGHIVEAEAGGCSEGFEKLSPVVRDIEQMAIAGNSTFRIYEFKTFINHVSKHIKNNPESTHCGNTGCLRCIDSLLGGPIIPA